MDSGTQVQERDTDAFVGGVHFGLAMTMASTFVVACMVGVWLSGHPVASKATRPMGALIAITAGMLALICGYVAHRAWRFQNRPAMATIS
jgi:putative flippase GtrA